MGSIRNHVATLRQKELAEAIIKNKGLPRDKKKNKKELLVSVGYSPVTAGAAPSKIMEQTGVQESIKSILEKAGLTETLVADSLVADIKGKPARRVRELELAADILSMRDGEKENENKPTVNVIVLPLEIVQKNSIPIKADATLLPTQDPKYSSE